MALRGIGNPYRQLGCHRAFPLTRQLVTRTCSTPPFDRPRDRQSFDREELMSWSEIEVAKALLAAALAAAEAAAEAAAAAMARLGGGSE